MNRLLRCIGIAVLMSSLAAASERGGDQRVLARTVVADSHVTVYVWDPFATAKNDAERATLRRVVQAWESKTGNSVDLLGNTGSNALRLCSDGPTGKAPDLIGVSHDQLSALRGCRVLRPLSGGTWPATDRARYINAAVQAATAGGQEWGMPWSVATSALFYNTSLVPRGTFGFQPPQWSTVIKRARRFPKRTGRITLHGLVWDASSLALDYGILSAAGGYVFKYGSQGFQRDPLGVDTPGSVAGLQFIRNLTTVGKYRLVAGNLGDVKAKDTFLAGRAALYITGSWDSPTFQQSHLPFGVTPMPAMGSHRAHPFATVQLFVVNRYSSHPQQAMSLLRYMTQHMQLPEFATDQRLPVLKQDLASYTVRRNPVAYALGRSALDAQAVPNIAAMNAVWGPMNVALAAIVTGRAQPAGAAHLAATRIRAGIRQLGG